MTQQFPKTPRQSYIDLSEAVKNWTAESSDGPIWDALQSIPITDEKYREIIQSADLLKILENGDKREVAEALGKALVGLEGFDSRRFVRESLYDMPTTARRAVVNLAEAVRTVNSAYGLRDMLTAIAALHVSEESRQTVLATFLANTPHRWGSSEIHRENLASALARLLDGEPKFDAARFIYHATSDSSADNDGKDGKWSYNRNSPEDALKTTIESDGETVEL